MQVNSSLAAAADAIICRNPFPVTAAFAAMTPSCDFAAIVGTAVQVNLIWVLGETATITIETLWTSLNVTAIVPLGAVDTREQGVIEAAAKRALVKHSTAATGVKAIVAAGITGAAGHTGHAGHTTGFGQVGHVGHPKIRKNVLEVASVLL